MARRTTLTRRKSTPERQEQIASLPREVKTITLSGQSYTVPVTLCPPPMQCEDLLPDKIKMNRRRG